jgi:uncharacterized membrane protein
MFQFLFKYPSPVFTKGKFVLLSPWPVWLLPLLIFLSAGGLALLIRWRIRSAAPQLRNWRAGVVWGLQSLLVAILLLLLWQPAMTVPALSSQKNIIAVIVDDSRSMAIKDSDGRSRETAALSTLQSGLLSGLQKRFQTRIYRLGNRITQMDGLSGISPTEASTHIGQGLKQFSTETSDLPVGAILLLTDGGENSDGIRNSGIDLDALQALKNRRLPVHTIGFGDPERTRDVELENIDVAANSIVNTRLAATVSWMQRGYAGEKATLTVRDGNRMLAMRDVTLAPNGVLQTESLFFSPGPAGAKVLRFGIEPLAGEENLFNNAKTRPVLVSDTKLRILYVEGEPRWEFKFIRRAEEDDPTVQLVSMLRTSENKIYRQGISNPDELADGFPVRSEDLFGYSGIIIGSVEADYFTPLQRELLREYVDRRGGGLLFLGGRSSLSDGGWGVSSVNELFPTFLPAGRSSFHRNSATVELTAEGLDSPVTRLLEDPGKNAERWKKLTYLADYEESGSPKPGATVLVQVNAGRRKLPLLITQNYGHGRTAIMATGGTWRWQMSQALGDPSHDLFWQQLLRWLVADSPNAVTATMPARTMMDEGRVQLTAQVRDLQFQPFGDARVIAHITGPGETSALLDLAPLPNTTGQYQTEWTAAKPGAYLAEVTATSGGQPSQELGRDAITFQREDGVAENFHTEQNRSLLQQLASQTGGRYWNPSDLKDLPRDISYSEAGISVRSTEELWNMPIVFPLLLGLPLAEWVLRRKWGVV